MLRRFRMWRQRTPPPPPPPLVRLPERLTPDSPPPTAPEEHPSPPTPALVARQVPPEPEPEPPVPPPPTFPSTETTSTAASFTPPPSPAAPARLQDESRLHKALRQGKPLKVIQEIVRSEPQSLRRRGYEGWLPLHVAAAKYGSVEVIAHLVDGYPGALKERTTHGATPLHVAVRFASVKEVAAASLADARTNALEVRSSKEAISFAAFGADKVEVVGCPAPRPPPNDAPRTNTEHQEAKYEVVKYLVKMRPESLKDTTNNVRRPMHIAARFAPLKVVKYLAQQDPDSLEARDKEGWLPLHMAAQGAEVEVIKELLAKRPSTLQRSTNSFWRPLHIAARFAPLKVVQLLVAKDPDALKAQDKDGWIPLHMACQGTDLEVVKFLQNKKPDTIMRTTNSRRLPLHVAAKYAPLTVVEYLAEAGPHALDTKDKAGWLPIHFAAEGASVEVVKHLANLRQETLKRSCENGWLPLHVAAKHAPLKVVRFLAEKDSRALQKENRCGFLPADIARGTARLEVADWLELRTARISEGSIEQAERPSLPVGGDDNKPNSPGSSGTNATDATADEDGYRIDRDSIRAAIELGNPDPVVVSCAYVDSLLAVKGPCLGKGGVGTVIRAKDSVLRRRFAIKFINADILSGGFEHGLVKAMKTFKTELEALSRFRHPNIAALIAYTDPPVETAHSKHYLLYELAEKGSLDKFLWGDNGRNDVGRSRIGSFCRRVQIAVDVMTAIRFLHVGSEGISSCFHRDVKSANVVIKRNFTAQLTDCGIAKLIRDDGMNRTSTTIMGTGGYICPQYLTEQSSYEAACDIYSFGVVLAELWTGRLQLTKDESGLKIHFGNQYVVGINGKKRDFFEDVDPALEVSAIRTEYMRRFTALALSCMKYDAVDRPPGQKVLKELREILEGCLNVKGLPGVKAALNHQNSSKLCTTCRTTQSMPKCDHCFACFSSEQRRNSTSEIIRNLCKLTAKVEHLSHQIENVGQMVEATLPVLACLDQKLNNKVPRTCLLVPAESEGVWQDPKAWIHSVTHKRFKLFFVCPVSHQLIEPPIELYVTKDWFEKAAPVLATGLVLLQIALKVGLNLSSDLSFDLDGPTNKLFRKVTKEEVLQMVDEFSALLKDTVHDGLVDRFRSQRLKGSDVTTLSGEAYELVVEMAVEQCGWMDQMRPVRIPPSPAVIWVAKAAAENPKYKVVTV